MAQLKAGFGMIIKNEIGHLNDLAFQNLEAAQHLRFFGRNPQLS
jgi:hypothetical protein